MPRRPILMVTNAGYGETPIPPDAIVQPGETVIAAREHEPTIPVDILILAVVPTGCCVDYAIADQANPPQPQTEMAAGYGKAEIAA
jgi:hypothetical protein